MAEVIVAGAGPTGLMLAGELALAGVDVQVVERRTTSELVGMRARGFHSRTIEILDQRGIADRFLAAGQTFASASFANTSRGHQRPPDPARRTRWGWSSARSRGS